MHKVYLGNECITLANDQELELYCSQYHQIIAAGGLVQNASGEYLMIFRRNCWDLPKGKQEPGEDTITCALREVEEETGLKNLKASDLICITHHSYMFQDAQCVKHTYWYRMTCDEAQELVPQAEEQIETVEWVPKDNLPLKLANTYPSIREVFTKAFAC